jgi:3-oxoadipyl-CoA thiolase
MSARNAWIVDGLRTPFGRYRGALSAIRADDLAALPIAALMARHPALDWAALDEVLLGCANQAGEDNRNVARMASLLAGLPETVPALTVNRLCASGLDAVGMAARAIVAGDAELAIAGGVESMSRAPYVMGKAESPYAREQQLEDTTMGWRFVNPRMRAAHGVDSMTQTAEHLAREHAITRADQDAYALRSQQRVAQAQAAGRFTPELMAMPATRAGKGLDADEQPRADTTLEKLAALPPLLGPGTHITAGNASGLNDGACALLLASDAALARWRLEPMARVPGVASAGVAPRVMGIGPVAATARLLARLGLELGDFGLVEINEAFAAQVLAVTRALGLPDDAAHVNPNGGAIALGHPLGASGTKLMATLLHALRARGKRYGLQTMCEGGGVANVTIVEMV